MGRLPGLARHASKPEESRGRLYPEPEHAMRSPFQRDRDRIIHSTAFRRLTHKTQVFVYHEGDHYRTRLTHSLEVAQIARTIARALGLDEDLAETVALAHDLGHTPFGHAGEEALNAEMAEFGGFSHNDQTLRILTSLEKRYVGFDGLNLTWRRSRAPSSIMARCEAPASTGRCRRRSPNMTADIRSTSTVSLGRRRRSRHSPTILRTITTISTTGCAPGSSLSPTSPMCRWSDRCFARSQSAIPRSKSRG